MFKYIVTGLLFMSFFQFNKNSLSGQNTTLSILVSGACGMCKERIENTSGKIVGVVSANYDIENQKLSLEVQPIFQKSDLIKTLLMVGHDTEGQVAPDDVYKNLVHVVIIEK
ncbi:MAG: heavy-metal-associated domain-containing protein [Saprospiraceae bacterium]|nr:heavy-metal-associated domain-containing protein [Saprospiraceae bacterium]